MKVYSTWTFGILLLVATKAKLHDSVNQNPQQVQPVVNTDSAESPIIEDLAPEVITLGGTVTGTTIRSHSGQAVSVYYGIPYGQPPTGPLRFLPPRAAVPWNGTFRANVASQPPYQQVSQDLGKILDQLNGTVPKPWTEDCLKLHVWVPQPAPVNAQVIVFIHGGAFITETALWYIDGSSFAADEGIIVVSVEYRLGVFGFLHMGHPEAPGNVGLMDQLQGLLWVKKNIASFGGDPEAITLMGTSAGSASVGYHLTSAASQGLYKRVIMMSGVPTNIWAFTTEQESLKKAESLAAVLQCRHETIPETVSCLRRKTPEELLEASLVPHMLASIQFGPIGDGQIVVSESSRNFNDADVLIGSTSDEGSEFFLLRNQEYAEKENSGIDSNDFLDVLEGIHDSLSHLDATILETSYTNWSNPDDPTALRDGIRNAYSDGLFVCHINQFADALAEDSKRKVFRYIYDYKFTPFWFPNVTWTRSVHGADQLATLGPPSNLPESPDDAEMRVKMVKHFANFAKTGDPNIETEPNWPRYLRATSRSFNLLDRKSKIGNEHRTQECAVWLKVLPLLRRSCMQRFAYH